MKKFLPYLLAIALVTTILVIPGKADDEGRRWGWKPYDNFEEPVIDSERWDQFPNDAADIYLDTVNGRVCFEQREPYLAETSSWLRVKKFGTRIRGIRADITVLDSCTGDVRGRLAGVISEVPTGEIFGQLALQGGLEPAPRAWGNLGLQDPEVPGFWEDLVWARFHQPLEIMGNTLTAEWTFSRDANVYYLTGYGRIHYVYPERIRIGGDRFLVGIGTRSSNGDGPCTVCFDNVWILTNNSTNRYK